MPLDPKKWIRKHRPGFFGSRKKQKIKQLNNSFGEGNWTLGWVVTFYFTHGHDRIAVEDFSYEFEEACKIIYEGSYFQYFSKHSFDLEYVCSFTEVIDNSLTNINSGVDYKIQEASSTHIQDIAIRNVLRRMGRWFVKPLELSEEKKFVGRTRT